MDRENRIKTLVKEHGIGVEFRAGMAYGAALVGPLGSFNRRIVTAIGKPVNIASRLESTGTRNCIHVEEKLLEILKNSVISKDTPVMWHVATSGSSPEPVPDVGFFSFFQDFFNLGPDLVQKRDPVSYKEFTTDNSYLINCIPEKNTQTVCAGI